MAFGESKKERMARRELEERQEQEKQQREATERERQRAEEKKLRADKFMADLEKQLKNKVITLILSDYEGNDWKQLAMNYLMEKEYVCVQNDISCTRSGAHYALTFVKKEYQDFFQTRK